MSEKNCIVIRTKHFNKIGLWDVVQKLILRLGPDRRIKKHKTVLHFSMCEAARQTKNRPSNLTQTDILAK